MYTCFHVHGSLSYDVTGKFPVKLLGDFRAVVVRRYATLPGFFQFHLDVKDCTGPHVVTTTHLLPFTVSIYSYYSGERTFHLYVFMMSLGPVFIILFTVVV